MSSCEDETCLLVGTPAVGVFDLAPRAMEDSLLGKAESGHVYKLGRGKFTKGNVAAAKDLLQREFPQVWRLQGNEMHSAPYKYSVAAAMGCD